jgi:hypothetical protein
MTTTHVDKFRSLSGLYGHRLLADDSPEDARLGKVHEFYFDDQTWIIRYLVADTGTWMPGKKLLIEPIHFGAVDDRRFQLRLKMSERELRGSADVLDNRPDMALNEEGRDSRTNDVHLRSTRQILNYHFETDEGFLGYVDDFIVNEPDWAIRYIVIDTKDPKAKKILISPYWVSEINWIESKMRAAIPREKILNSPEFIMPLL